MELCIYPCTKCKLPTKFNLEGMRYFSITSGISTQRRCDLCIVKYKKLAFIKTKLIPKLKSVINKKIKQVLNFQLHDYECSKCSQVKKRVAAFKDGQAKYIYHDEVGKRWASAKVCPSCYHSTYVKKPERFFNNICSECSAAFTTKSKPALSCSSRCRTFRSRAKRRKPKKTCLQCKANPASKKYCSLKCQKLANKPKPRPKVKVFKPCRVCANPTVNIYCTKRCSKTHHRKIHKPTKNEKLQQKHYKKLRRRACTKAKLRNITWNQIEEVYKNKPRNYDIDHIIPLNHKDVCGLHVPWNMQYLAKAENNLKSNKFDYTYENNSWRLL